MNNEALRLADTLERMSLSTRWDKEAAAELRRLHEMNQELVEALKTIEEIYQYDMSGTDASLLLYEAKTIARCAIDKATGESNG